MNPERSASHDTGGDTLPRTRARSDCAKAFLCSCCRLLLHETADAMHRGVAPHSASLELAMRQAIGKLQQSRGKKAGPVQHVCKDRH